MKPSLVSRALRTLLVGERQPISIWGSPGTGKSAVLHQLAAELGIALRDIRALLLDPVDLRGLPFVGKDGRSQWATPDFLTQDGKGILFLDELNAAPAMVQASCYQLVLGRKLANMPCRGDGQLSPPAIAIRTRPLRPGCPRLYATGSFTSTSRWTCRNGASGRSRRVSGPRSLRSFVSVPSC